MATADRTEDRAMLAIELSTDEQGRHFARERDGSSEVITVSFVPLSEDEERGWNDHARILEAQSDAD